MEAKHQRNRKLRKARRERGWTQAQLAEKLAAGISTVRSWERGDRSASLVLLSRLCTLFQMTPEELGFVSPQEDQERTPTDHGEDGKRPVEKSGSQEAFRERASDGTQIAHRPTEHHDDENRYRMLNRVQSRWISGFLDHVSGGPLIPLNLQLRPDAVANPWRTKNQEPYPSVWPETTDMHIVEVYHEADGELLILGEPGAGKTTLLLELMQELVEQCRQDEALPIPVIFHLSGWAEKKASLANWLTEELNLKYQVPLKIAQQWIANDQILPLLDGLDEVEQVVRSTCVTAINTYRQEHGFIPMVVCCRTSDYDALPEHLVLGMAVVAQPLTLQQIDDYISMSRKDLTAMRMALQTDAGLQEIISTPLMLTILADNFQEISPKDALTLQSSRHIVIEHYIERLLRKETKQRPRSTPQQIKGWLSWLAWQMVQHNQAELYIERMQPDWIENSQQRHHYRRTVIRIVMGIHCLVSGALVAWLKGGLKDGVVGSGNGILGLFGGGSGNSMLGWMSPGIGGGSQGGASLIIILGIVIWLVTILVGSTSLPTITPRAIRQGLLSGLLAGLKLGIPISIVGIPFFTLFGGLQHGISYGLGIGFFLGILVGLMHGLEVGLRYEQQQRSPQTTEKISFSDRLIDGLILGIGAGLSFMVVEDLLKVSHTSTLIYSGIVFLFFFFAYGFGGGTNLFASLAQTITPAETVTWSWRSMTHDLGENSQKSLIVALITCISVGVVIASITSLFFSDISYGIHYGLVFGTISGLIVGIAAILTSMLKSGWSSNMLPEDQHIRPNEGIARSGRNSLLGASFFAPIGGIASGLACAIGFGLIGQLPKWPVMGIAFALMLAIMFFVIFAIAQGGIAWIEHYTLRWYLWRAGSLPLRFVRFLNSASEYALLRKIGGGYMFTHRLVLEYFARLYQSERSHLS